MSEDIAPLPADEMTIRRAQSGCGWLVIHDGETKAAFSTVRDMCSYLDTYLSPLDIEAGVIPRKHEPQIPAPDMTLPKMFEAKEELPRPGLWRVLTGGRS